MNYPLISEYVDAILSAEDNFDKLVNLRPVLDDKERPVMSVGNFAVVFKMKDKTNGRLYAVKCFIKDQEGRAERYAKITEELQYVSSPYLINVKYLERELFVETKNCAENEFPVLIMDWVDGKTLDEYIRTYIHNKYAMQMLFYRFCKMGAWLMSQTIAHGDLKPDNIIVRKDGTLVLVDYDGMYVQTMEGEKATEIGSNDFRHPLRTDKDFNEHIDDFAIASIAVSLKTIALNPSFFDRYSASDRLLFSASDYRDIGQSAALQAIMSLASEPEMSTVISLFLLAVAKTNLSSVSFRLLLFNEPEKPLGMDLSTRITEEENKNAVRDEYGALYTADGLKLIKGPLGTKSHTYNIRQGTLVIGGGAFFECSSLQSITIPDSVTSIGDSAFSWCSSLPSITIPDSVTSIGDRAFEGCSYLQSITIPDSVTSIGDDAFSWCSSLQSITIPDSVTSIGDSAFEGCSSLQSITIPDSVTSIGDRAFWRCSSLQSITIPDSVTSIGDSAFDGCSSIQSITIPDSVTSIGDRAFEGCYSLQSITIPDSVTSIGDSAFSCCTSLIKVNVCNKNYYTKDDMLISSQGVVISCWSKSEHIVLPYGVTSIGDWAFNGCDSLQSITIPDSVTSIGDRPFFGCTSLQSITIPDSVTSIGDGAFSCCTSLIKVDVCNKNYYTKDDMLISSQGVVISCWSKSEHIVLPYGVTSIGDSAFEECRYLQSINIPDSVTSIGDWAFNGCDSLQYITIPDSVTSIGDGAFWKCYSLQSINIPDSVTSIGDGVFSCCTSLIKVDVCNKNYYTKDDMLISSQGVVISCWSKSEHIVLPYGVTSIGDSAFEECCCPQSINIPDSVTSIGDWAFKGCSSLQYITIPGSVTSIGDSAFWMCSSLQSIIIPLGTKQKFINMLGMGNASILIEC